MRFRRADLSDIDRLAEIRKKQLQDEGMKPDTDMDAELRAYFHEMMSKGELIEWVAETEESDTINGKPVDAGRIIATAAIVFMTFPPAFTNPTGRKGYVANVYTADEYRGQGLARKLMQKLEQEALERGITVLVLHASKMGRKVYAKQGYEVTDTVMEKHID